MGGSAWRESAVNIPLAAKVLSLLSNPSQRNPVAIEDVVLWTAFVGGVLGAISFFWQVYYHYAAKEENIRRSLNAKVLKPLSEVKIQRLRIHGHANAIAVVIPKEALPADVVPTTSQEGLGVRELPGLERGITFLQKRYPAVHEQWLKFQQSWNQYTAQLKRRRELLEPRIGHEMGKEFPKLGPARFTWSEKDTYVLDNIMAFAESRGWDAIALGEAARPLSIAVSRIQSGNTFYFEIKGDEYGTMVYTHSESIADPDAMKRVISSCLTNAELKRINTELIRDFKNLNEAVEAFRISLREVAIAVDVAGR
jgi:hypothetical protein